MKTEDDEFQRLLDRHLDSELTGTELAELERLVMDDPGRRSRFLKAVCLENSLVALRGTPASVGLGQRERRRETKWSLVQPLLGIAAGFAAASALWLWFGSQHTSPPRTAVAEATTGIFEANAGEQTTFTTDEVSGVIDGPGRVDVSADGALTLISGKVTLHGEADSVRVGATTLRFDGTIHLSLESSGAFEIHQQEGSAEVAGTTEVAESSAMRFPAAFPDQEPTAAVYAPEEFPIGARTWIADLDLSLGEQEWRTMRRDRSVNGSPMRLGGRAFSRGVGTFPSSELQVELNGATRFIAHVGLDDEAIGSEWKGCTGSAKFTVKGDGEVLWNSPVKRPGDPPDRIDIDTTGVGVLQLIASTGGDGHLFDFANWANACLIRGPRGSAPRTRPPHDDFAPASSPPSAPQLGHPRAFVVRTGAPLSLRVPVLGERPMSFTSADLPGGLVLDPGRGLLSGTLDRAGEYQFVIRAESAHGGIDCQLSITAGDGPSQPTPPPMVWSTGPTASAQEVRADAERLVELGLADAGWRTVLVEDSWQGVRDGENHALEPNQRFPSLPSLAADLRARGLVLGLGSTPNLRTPGGFIGGSAPTPHGDYTEIATDPGERHLPTALFPPAGTQPEFDRPGRYPLTAADLALWSRWGVGYAEFAWSPLDHPTAARLAAEAQAAGGNLTLALRGAGGTDWTAAPEVAHVTLELPAAGEDWDSVLFAAQLAVRRPGDLRVSPGRLLIGVRRDPAGGHIPSPLDPAQQRAQLSMWCLLSAPLTVECDLEFLTPSARSLLTNPEVIALQQDRAQRHPHALGAAKNIWVRELADGALAVGIFNFDATEMPTPQIPWQDLGGSPADGVRDLWQRNTVSLANLPDRLGPHGCLLLRVERDGGH